ncbi:MAG TPA: FumA C-terminus/TtdB family hydratase beta subunit [Candidatus Cloacimonadota bacterium]|nr:FumA C-terminus/TtdB family hydratase beta subunit [Candidatus Cloacimonadota bacterium]HPT71024.1 FumA C-terminus/TtdB family hydratase beta subunit [Candidatus Cloacimonadota bacterium]
MEHHIQLPWTYEIMKELHAGDKVYLTGVLYTARDAAHKRLDEMILNGRELPFDLTDQIIFYAGPTPPRPGQVVGSIGPTTSARMDTLTPPLIRKGLRGMIGKGDRSEALHEAMKGRAVYFVAIGGASVLLAESITKMEIAFFEDLGPEAIYRLEVADFPCYVAIDLEGNDIFHNNRQSLWNLKR